MIRPSGSIRNVAGIVVDAEGLDQVAAAAGVVDLPPGDRRAFTKSITAALVSSRLTPTISNPASRYFA